MAKIMANKSIINNVIDRPITLIGHMGCGKSTIGKLLSSKLNIDFYDTDKELEKSLNKKIYQIFLSEGEKVFREYELDVVNKLLSKKNCVIATGGGAFIYNNTREKILNKSISLWLRTDLEILYKRVKHSKKRPLLNKKNKLNRLKELALERDHIYSKANLIIETENLNKEQLTDKIILQLNGL